MYTTHDAHNRGKAYLMPIHLPNLRCRPDFVVGIPVVLDTLRNSQVIPNARFHEKVIPGPSFISILTKHLTTKLLMQLSVEINRRVQHGADGIQ